MLCCNDAELISILLPKGYSDIDLSFLTSAWIFDFAGTSEVTYVTVILKYPHLSQLMAIYFL